MRFKAFILIGLVGWYGLSQIEASSMSKTGQIVDYKRLAKAIYKAEGGKKAVKPYGILKDYCKPGDPDGQCLKGCLQTIDHAVRDYKGGSSHREFIKFLGSRYAPIHARNDPHDLNSHWVYNVTLFYERG